MAESDPKGKRNREGERAHHTLPHTDLHGQTTHGHLWPRLLMWGVESAQGVVVTEGLTAWSPMAAKVDLGAATPMAGGQARGHHDGRSQLKSLQDSGSSMPVLPCPTHGKWGKLT